MVTGTVGMVDKGNCITTVDWLSVHFAHAIDSKPHVVRTGRPFGPSNHSTGAGIPLTVGCST